MKNILLILYYGYGILIVAALINWAGKSVGFKSWYDVLGELNFEGVSFLNLVWLMVVYPFLLGVGFLFLKFLRGIFHRNKK